MSLRRILVTGGCGFIGTNLIARLAQVGGPAVRVLDNESLGKRKHLDGLDVDFVAGDVCDPATVDAALQDVDAVVHLAADTRVMDSISDPGHNFTTNVVGTFNLLQRMRAAGVTRLVNASTGGAIIGEADPPVHEGMVANPISPYGASKLASEGYCNAFSGSFGFDAASLRFSNVYGPRSWHKGSVVAHFFKGILAGEELVIYGDGEQERDFVFVEDLADGIYRALEKGVAGVYQLGTGVPTSVNTLVEEMRGVVGPDWPVKVRYEPERAGEIKRTWCRIEKARGAFGYAPDTPFADGLSRTWDWFLAVKAGI